MNSRIRPTVAAMLALLLALSAGTAAVAEDMRDTTSVEITESDDDGGLPDDDDRPDRPDQPERPDRPDQPDRPGAPDRPERPERPDLRPAPSERFDCVDLNTASRAAIAGLPGLDLAAAEAIIDGRPYRSIDDVPAARQIEEACVITATTPKRVDTGAGGLAFGPRA